MMYQLDNDIFSHAFDGRYQLRERIDRVRENGDLVVVSVMTRIEALRPRFENVYKAATSAELTRALEWLIRTEAFLNGFGVIEFDATAVAHFDRFRKEKKFRNFKRGDMLHACIALAHDATLVTRNTKDFQAVPNLKLDNWAV